jgi:hypothetical protein
MSALVPALESAIAEASEALELPRSAPDAALWALAAWPLALWAAADAAAFWWLFWWGAWARAWRVE